jgi:hypothetical protein
MEIIEQFVKLWHKYRFNLKDYCVYFLRSKRALLNQVRVLYNSNCS